MLSLFNVCVCVCVDLFQKLLVTEHPLYLRLVTGPDADHLTFVLKEKESEEVEVRRRPARHATSHHAMSHHVTAARYSIIT